MLPRFHLIYESQEIRTLIRKSEHSNMHESNIINNLLQMGVEGSPEIQKTIVKDIFEVYNEYCTKTPIIADEIIKIANITFKMIEYLHD